MIFTIFKKELRDTLRDRRTLIAMMVVPIVVFPLILGVMTKVSQYFEKTQKEEVFNIGLIADEHSLFVKLFTELPEEMGPKKIVFMQDSSEMRSLVKEDSLQMGLVVPTDFDAVENKNGQHRIHLFFEGTNLGAKQRGETYINYIKDHLLTDRLASNSIPTELINPIEINYRNISSDKEMIGKLVGGILPYLFIIFGFIGCMYPAIDLFTGEKERKTLETLLTTPVARWKILIGKMMVVVVSGIAAASFALIGLFLALEVFQLVEDPKMLAVIRSVLSLQFIAMLYLLLLPLTIFFAGVMVPVTVYAKTFKEAQSILTPVNFVILLPALVGFLPNIELNVYTALIPIVNIVLSTKELIAETLNPFLMLLSFAAMVLFALIAVFISYKRFGKESNIIT